jgi:hypothetical protein
MEPKNGHLLLTFSKKGFPILSEMGNNVEKGMTSSVLKMGSRWHNHLDPMVRKSPWNETEEFVFIKAH